MRLFKVPRQLLSGEPAFALIDVKTGFVPQTNVDAVLHAVFRDFNQFRRFFAGQNPRMHRKPFPLTRRRVRPVKESLGARHRHQIRHDFVPAAFGTGALKLRHEPVAVLINDQPGDTVGFAEHDTARARAGEQPLARLHGLFKTSTQKFRHFRIFRFVKRPHAHPQRRFRRICAVTQKASVRRRYLHRFTGIGLTRNAADGRVVHPRMTTQKAFFLSFFKLYFNHDVSLLRLRRP